MAKKTYDLLFKLLLVGDSGVGKQHLICRFTDGVFNTTACIFPIGIDFKIKTVEMEGKKIKLQIWDTAGQERFRTLTAVFFRGAVGVILVYDITNEKSFESVPRWLQDVEKHANEDVETMLLGNKCDKEDKRQISTEKAMVVAKQHSIKFFETSAKTNVNVETAFMELAGAILQKMNKQSAKDNATGDAADVQLSAAPSSKKCW